jgi:hypothetical protein
VTFDLASLPRRALPATTRLYRIHRTSFTPWYFDGDGAGRFDPVANAGRGACYWATDPLGAWVEVFRTRMTLSDDDMTTRRLSSVLLERVLLTVDLTDRHALLAGVTVSLTAGPDYGPSQALAAEIDGAHIPAVLWRVRHDLAQELCAVAWFGEEGAVWDSASQALPAPTITPIPLELVDRAAIEFGYEILAVP